MPAITNVPETESVRPRNSPYAICRARLFLEKGAIVGLIWTTLVGIALIVQVINGLVAIAVVSLSFPVAGWIADTWIGRYKILRTAMHLLLISSTVGIPVQMALMYYPLSIILYALNTAIFCITAAAAGCYAGCFIQFATDQMIGASSDQLSFTVHWLLWGIAVGYFTNAVLHSVLKDRLAVLVCRCLSLLTLLIACFVLWRWTNSLMTVPQISNPIKHIFRVLNYARKHKFPERRSALTFWEEDYPSRIDLGKDKYGGPFTVEEVEDVKTTLRLIPIVLCTALASVGCWITWLSLMCHEHYHCVTRISKLRAVLNNSNNFGIIIGIVFIPLYDFALLPIFHRYVPTMLKRIAAGILLLSVSYFLSNFLKLGR